MSHFVRFHGNAKNANETMLLLEHVLELRSDGSGRMPMPAMGTTPYAALGESSRGPAGELMAIGDLRRARLAFWESA